MAQFPPVRVAALPLLTLLAGGLGVPADELPAPATSPWRAQLSERIPRLFVDAINDVIRGTIRPARIRYSPPGTLFLEDAVLLDPRGQPVARIERARADVAVTPLLTGNVVIEELVLERPVLELAQADDGTLNLIEALSPKDRSKGDNKGPPDVDIRLKDVRVSDGRFSFENPDGVRVSARDIDGRARVDVDLQQRTVVLMARQLTAAAGRVDLAELGVPFGAVRVERVRVVNDRLEVTNARGSASGAEVRGGGSLSWAGAGRLNLQGRVVAPKGTWPERLERLPFELPALDANVTVTGSFREPSVGAKGSFESFRAFDYPIDSGTGEVVVTEERARILSATLRSGAATLSGRGTVLFTPRTLDLEGRVEALPLRLALAPAKLDDGPRATLAGSYRLVGTFALDDGPLLLTSTLSARGLRFADVTPPSPLQVVSRLSINDELVRVESAELTGKGVRASVSGGVLIKEERVDLRLSASADAPARWLPDLPERLDVETASFEGSLAGPFAKVVVSGALAAPKADVFGVPLRGLTAKLTASAEQVRLADIRGSAAGGSARARVNVRLPTRKGGAQALSGEIEVTGAQLARVRLGADGELRATGEVSLLASLSGTPQHPIVSVSGTAAGASLEGEQLGDVRTRMLVTRDLLRVQTLEVIGPIGRLIADGALTLRFDDLALGGAVLVELNDLSRVAAAKELALAGRARGRVRLDGTAEGPEVLAWLSAEDLMLRGAPLGDGPLFARVRTVAGDDAGERARVVELSGRLVGPRGLIKLRAAYDIDRERVNALLRLVDADLQPWLEMAPALLGTDAFPAAAGLVDGVIRASGPVRNPDLKVRLRVPELVFLDQETQSDEEVSAAPPASGRAAAGGSAALSRADEMRRMRSQGGLFFAGDLVDRQLDALLCAFPGGAEVTVSPCGGSERVWLRATGRVDLEQEAFALELRGYVDEANLERFVPALRELDADVSLVATGRASVVKAGAEASVEVSGDASLLAATIDLADTPPAVLERSARLRFERNKVFLEEPVRFSVGDSEVTVAGYAGPGDVRLKVDGTVLLALAKLYSAEVTQASGTVFAGIEIVIENGVPAVSGHITPGPGAAITLRSLRDRMELRSGRLAFEPIPAAGERTTAERITIDDLQVAIGGGEGSLEGAFTVLLSATDAGLEVSKLTGFDLVARGEGISARRDRSRVEAAFNLRLEERAGEPLLRGLIEITDGLYRERFELLDNFVLASPERPSTPLYQTLAPFGLADLALNVDVDVRDFEVRADIVTFPMDAALTGSLKLSNTLRVPALSGALEIVEGSLTFPTARFEIVDSQIEFPQERAALEPRINLTARAELPPGRTGCETDLPVLLSLTGESTEEVQLDLEAETGERHTRFDLLMNVLFGQRLAQCEAERGLGDPTNAAVRAFTGQLFASGFTQQIEDAIADSFGGEIQFNLFVESGRLGTDVRWQLGRRVVFEGEAPLYTWEAGTGAGIGDRAALNASNLRLRFLLFDHLPPGDGELFLETELSSEEDELVGNTESNLEGRLKYRLFEY